MNNARLTEIDIRAGVAPPTTTESVMTAGTAPVGGGAELTGDDASGDDGPSDEGPGDDGSVETEGAGVDEEMLGDGGRAA